MNSKQKEFIKILNTIALEKNRYEVFCDFLQLGALTFVQSAHFTKEREDRYLQTIGKYEKEDQQKFPKLLALVVEGLDEGFGDFLGEVYMNCDFGSSKQGQFFTPYSVCKMCAETTITDLPKDRILTAQEPCVGGGAMIIALCDVMHAKGFNFQQNLLVDAMDVSINSVYMAVIQFTILGIPAVIVHGNSLSLEVWDVFETPAVGMFLVKERYAAQQRRDRELLQEKTYIEKVKMNEEVLRTRKYKEVSLFD